MNKYNPTSIALLLLTAAVFIGALVLLVEKLKVLTLLVLIMLVVGGTMLYYQRRRSRGIASVMSHIGNPYHIQTAILKEVQNVAELIVLRENFEQMMTFENAQKMPFFDINLPFTSNKITVKYQSHITCGCRNLSDIKIGRSVVGSTIHFAVPQSEILDKYVDMNSIEICAQDSGFFASIKLDEQNHAIAEHFEQMVQERVNDGLLEKANENIRQMLSDIATRHNLIANVEFVQAGFSGGNQFLTINELPLLEGGQ